MFVISIADYFPTTQVQQPGGSDLLAEFEADLLSKAEQADNRNRIVSERIAQLEEELADLRLLQRKIEAASTA